ncbi:hypothetical protein V6O07_23810, partial [Arthrospira platensis SPKY2]
LAQTSRPQLKYITHRLNELEDGTQTNEVEYEISFDPYFTIWRGPNEGTLNQTGGQVTYKTRWKRNDYKYKIQIYETGDWDDGVGSGSQLLHEEIINISDIDNPSGTWAPWRKRIKLNIANFNPIAARQGKNIFSRIQSYFTGSWGTWYGPLDNGYSVFGWRACTRRKVLGGFYYKEVYDAVISDLTNNTFPTYNRQASVSVPPRQNGALNPYSIITINSNITDINGDTMDITWLGRNRYPESIGKPLNSSDITLLPWSEVNDTTKNYTISALDFLKKLATVVPQPDRYEIGVDFGYRDRFTENGVVKQSTDLWFGAGSSMLGWMLEYPIDNVRTKIDNATDAIRTTISGQNVVVINNISASIYYETPRGYDGVKHAMCISCFPIGVNISIFDKYLIGQWYEKDDWHNRLTLPTTRTVNANIYELIGRNNDLRGCFFKFYTGATTPGGWSYDTYATTPISQSDVVFLNAFPRCVLNTISINISSYIDINYTITDKYFNLKSLHIDMC